MKLEALRSFTFSISVTLCSAAMMAQVTIDATVPIRGRIRNPTAGHGGSVGRKLPLRVELETRGSPPDEKGLTEVEFILANTGKEPLTLPISPHPGDMEPSDPKVSYTLQVLHLYVTSDKRQELTISGRTDLYGKRDSPEAFVKLAPGESIRVLTRVALPTDPSLNGAAQAVFVAHVVLDDETIKTRDGQTTEDTQEVGSAGSSEYKPQSFYKRPD